MKLLIAVLILSTPSLFAQGWKELSLKEFGYIVGSTSELDDGLENEDRINYKYGIGNLSDGNYTTAWVEGAKGNGIGESVYIVIPRDCRTITIFAGYGKSPAVYSSNNRVKRIKLSCYIGVNPEGGITELDWLGYMSKKFPVEFQIDLKDEAKLQTFSFPFPYEKLYSFSQEVKNSFNNEYKLAVRHIHTILQIEIEDVYKGSKFDDTCISELSFSTNNTGIIIKKVYEKDKNKSIVLFDTNKKTGNILLSDSNYIYWVMDTVANNEWLRIERAPAKVGEGRVETEDFLYYVPEKKEIPLPVNALKFEMRHGIAYLKMDDDFTLIQLSDLLDNFKFSIQKQK